MTNTFIKLLIFSLLYGSLVGCRSLEENAKYQLSDGTYRFKPSTGKAQRVYVEVEEDSLVIYPLLRGRQKGDTTQAIVLDIEETGSVARKDYLIFSQPSFDLDVITILFKYRPNKPGIPRQLNTDFNGAMYLGYRADSYTIQYKPTPLNNYKRRLNHFGYSIGLFTGLGSTAVTPWVTQDKVALEYDGLVFVNGISANIGLNNLTFGLGLGFDFLMDRNRKHWVYQGAPWLGLTLGLNLN